jgi:hypothetical protein
MHITLVSITALLLTSFPCIAAIDSINAPSSVKAGTDFVVSVDPGPEKPAFSGDHFTAYRVYLAIAPPEKIKRSLEPVCYLAISSTVSSTEFTVQIPADIGPSGPDSLAIATRRFNERGDKSDISYSVPLASLEVRGIGRNMSSRMGIMILTTRHVLHTLVLKSAARSSIPKQRTQRLLRNITTPTVVG